jgi:transcriptional regulator with XRE-family HTH domain
MITKLKRQRKMLGWSQFELAKAADIAPGRISFAETGRVRLNDEELARVKSALAKRAEEVARTVAA